MTPADLKSARQALGLSVEGFASVVGVDGRTVRRWEDGTRAISGSITVLVDLMLKSPSARKHLGIKRPLAE